jgi:glutamate/tyrosine decarboxylase-like PLP-dependent enzyme
LTYSAFGIFARVLPQEDEYKTLHKRVEGLELADSITVDGHKLLNVVSVLPSIDP